MLDIVCLYSSGSIATITVITHPLPFHHNVLTNSNSFSIELLSNETIVWGKYFIYAHNDFVHTLTHFTVLICAISTLFVNLPKMVSVSNIMLETCKNVCMINAIRINEKIVYLHISVLLFGLTAPMIWMFWRLTVVQMVPYNVLISGLTQVSEQTMSMPVHFIFIAW